jgi:hypothetical protein
VELQHYLLSTAGPLSLCTIRGPADALDQGLRDLLVFYYQTFGYKSCVSEDVRQYLAVLAPAPAAELAAALRVVFLEHEHAARAAAAAGAEAGSDAVSEAKNKGEKRGESKSGGERKGGEKEKEKERGSMGGVGGGGQGLQARNVAMCVSLKQVERFAGLHLGLTTDALEAEAVTLHGLYLQSLAANPPLEATDRGCGDDLLLLCAHTLIYLHARTRSPRYLFDAVYVLEHALQQHSKFNFQFKLLLVRLLCHADLGNFARASKLYESLEVRTIQLDSLTHFLCDDALRWGFAKHAETRLTELLEFHADYKTDGPLMVETALRQGNYSKALEFEEFRARLEASAMRRVAELELQRLALVDLVDCNGGSSEEIVAWVAQHHAGFESGYGEHAAALDAALDALVCNHDFGVMSVWDSQEALSSALHRPAHHIHPDGWDIPFDEYTRKAEGGAARYFATSRHTRGYVGAAATLPVLLGSVLAARCTAARAYLHTWRTHAEALQLLDAGADADAAAAAGAGPGVGLAGDLGGFGAFHWRAAFLLLECGVSVQETIEATAAWMRGVGAPFDLDRALPSEALYAANTQRWTGVARQFAVIRSLFVSLGDYFARAAFLPPAVVAAGLTEEDAGALEVDKQGSAQGTVRINLVSSRVVPEVGVFVNFASFLAVVLLPHWDKTIPTKTRGADKGSPKVKAGEASPEVPLELMKV